MDTGMSAVSSTRAAVWPAPPVGLRIGTPLLLRDETGCVRLEAQGPRGRASVPWSEAYAYDRTVLAPVAGSVSTLTARIVAVVPFAVPGTGEPDVAFSARLIDAATGAVLPVAFSVVEKSWRPAAEAISLEFPIAGLAPGRYLLYVTAEDRVSRTMAHAQTALIVAED
jgi:hypothetical protein